MSARRTERLLNLVICLLATRRWLTKEQIRAAVPQYADCETSDAFDRMFERDKDDLRELGIPVLTGSGERLFEDETGYRIDRDAYALPPVQLDAEELAVVGLASRVWQQASLAGPAAQALAKLTALGVETDEDALAGLEPRIRTAEPAFEALYAATRDRRVVTFAYRKPEGDLAVRTVEPWAVASRSGHWYLVGHDRDRGAARVFRLSRIEGEVTATGARAAYTVPADLDPRSMLGHPQSTVDGRTAVVLVRTGRAAGLRRRAIDEGTRDRPGFDRLRFEIHDAGIFAADLTALGPDVVVLEPEDLKDDVRRHLAGALARQTGIIETPAAPMVTS